MKLKPNEIYHLYNRGINRQPIFFEKENYYFFLQKVKNYFAPNCIILAYAFMPTHFHFLITANNRSTIRVKRSNFLLKNKPRKKSRIKMTLFSKGLKMLLSSYARAINIRFDRTGSLFQQNTKLKLTSSESLMEDYSLICFNYIHNNPVKSGLVNSPDEYEFSSYKDFMENNPDSICNLELARKLLSLDQNELFKFKSTDISPEVLKKIF